MLWFVVTQHTLLGWQFPLRFLSWCISSPSTYNIISCTEVRSWSMSIISRNYFLVSDWKMGRRESSLSYFSIYSELLDIMSSIKNIRSLCAWFSCSMTPTSPTTRKWYYNVVAWFYIFTLGIGVSRSTTAYVSSCHTQQKAWSRWSFLWSIFVSWTW